MKPLFVHDCDRCKFLGNMLIPSRNEVADVYMSCGTELPAVIFRWSDDPPDYSHVLTSILERYFNPKFFPSDEVWVDNDNATELYIAQHYMK